MVVRLIMNYIASVSFGKDSLAMLYKILELNDPVDEVVFFDTGMEFSCIYSLMNKIRDDLANRDIKFTRLKADKDFLYYMFDHEVHHKDGTCSYGYKWCGARCRWFTSKKTMIIKRYLKQQYGTDYIEYVGIAYDEPDRLKKNEGKLLPLIDLKMTEQDCLNYCHSLGFYWYEGEHELYEYLDRVSCWCCRNKNLKELKNIFEHFKVYWFALCELENRCNMNMKSKPLRELEDKWKKEVKGEKYV